MSSHDKCFVEEGKGGLEGSRATPCDTLELAIFVILAMPNLPVSLQAENAGLYYAPLPPEKKAKS